MPSERFTPTGDRVVVDWFAQILDTRVRDLDWGVTGHFVFVPSGVLKWFDLPAGAEQWSVTPESLREAVEWLIEVEDNWEGDAHDLASIVERYSTEPFVPVTQSPISGMSLDEIIVEVSENPEVLALLALVEVNDTTALVIKGALGLVLVGFSKAFTQWVEKASARLLSGLLPWVPEGEVKRPVKKAAKTKSALPKSLRDKLEAERKDKKKAVVKRSTKRAQAAKAAKQRLKMVFEGETKSPKKATAKDWQDAINKSPPPKKPSRKKKPRKEREE